jgi:hypothetical protein
MNMYLSNGQVLQIYLAANAAVGTYLPCDITGVIAASTSPQDFRVASPCFINDLDAGLAVGGSMEINANGQPSGVIIPTTAAFLATNSGRPSLKHIGLRPNVTYRLQMRTVGAA